MSKVEFRVRCVSIAWAPALAPVKHVPVVDVGSGQSRRLSRRPATFPARSCSSISDVLKTWDDLFAEYSKAPPVIDLGGERQSEGGRFHGHARARHSLPAYELRRGRNRSHPASSAWRAKMASAWRACWPQVTRCGPILSIPNRIGGPIKTSNVIAEIKGSEKPDEFVILGAHLDSWELGTGALDNGCNAALVVDALRAIKASGLKPRRTIRFILFSGEEEGLLGSRAYATKHRPELDKTAGVIIFDSGTGKTTGFSDGGRKDVLETAKRLLAPLQQFGLTDLKTDMEWGTDHFDFMFEGVPTFVADQDEANYLENYHAISDTYDKVDFAQLKKDVAEAAEFAFALANLQEKIGPRFTRAQIEQSMHETGADQTFKADGVWDAWESGRIGRQK